MGSKLGIFCRYRRVATRRAVVACRLARRSYCARNCAFAYRGSFSLACLTRLDIARFAPSPSAAVRFADLRRRHTRNTARG